MEGTGSGRSVPAVLTHGGGHLPPLQHHVLGDAPVGVHVHALVLVAHQQLDAVGVGQDDDGVRLDAGLDLHKRAEPLLDGSHRSL